MHPKPSKKGYSLHMVFISFTSCSNSFHSSMKKIKIILFFSLTDGHFQILMPVGEKYKAFWCVRDWDNVVLWKFHEVYMLVLVMVGPASIMTVAYALICWEVWNVMERRSVMTSRQA